MGFIERDSKTGEVISNVNKGMLIVEGAAAVGAGLLGLAIAAPLTAGFMLDMAISPAAESVVFKEE